MFKIISVGWNCEQFLEQTLQSVLEQDRDDWEICIVYDKSGDAGAQRIYRWLGEHGGKFLERDEQFFAVRNQVEGIRLMAPDPEDIIVFLDLDGDRLAHPQVLSRLADYYADGTLVTYGNYRPVPDPGTCNPALPVPPDVVASNSYRQYCLRGGCFFNHLRTMKGKVFDAIPDSYFRWTHNGAWYDAGTDYTFMMAALELAGGRYKCIEEVLLLYNHDNPLADNIVHPQVSSACTVDSLNKMPLEPLPR